MVRIDNPTEYEVMRPDGRTGRAPPRRVVASPGATLAVRAARAYASLAGSHW
jgi:hypothetical protein